RDLLPVNGEKRQAVTSMTACLSPFTGRGCRQAGEVQHRQSILMTADTRTPNLSPPAPPARRGRRRGGWGRLRGCRRHRNCWFPSPTAALRSREYLPPDG